MRRILVLIPVLLPLGALAQDTSEEDRGFIQGLIEDALSDTSREVRLEKLPGRAVVAGERSTGSS